MALRRRQADDPARVVLSGSRLIRVAAAAGLLAALALALAACGTDDPPSDGSGYAPAPGSDGAKAEEQAPEPRPGPLLSDGDRVLLIGDSLATEAPPTYADLLPAAAAKLGVEGVETINLAEPGTTTADWLPGRPLFEERLRPELGGADLVLVTAGGNDLEAGIGADDGVAALSTGASAADDAFAAIERTGRNMRKTFGQIRATNPDAAIAYVAYPDYSASSVWQAAGGSGATLALGVGLGGLLDAAEDAGPDAVVDMLTATGQVEGGIDPLLAEDPEYLSPAGHEFYAEGIAASLTEPPG